MLAPFWSLPHLRVILTYEDPLPCLLWRQPQSSRWYTRLMSRKTGGDLLPSTLLPFFPMAFWCFIALLFPAEVIHLVYKKRPQPQKSNSTFQNSYWQKRCKKNHAATGLWRSKHMSATACAAIILVVLLLWPVASSSSNSWARGRTSPHQWGSSRGCWDRQKASSNFFLWS